MDMGIEPFLVSSTLIGSMAQRLVRRICVSCKTSYVSDRGKLPADFTLDSGALLYRGTGCPACRQTGFRGRTGLYELMTMSDTISDAVMRRAPTPEVVQVARASGLRLLREDGWLKVRQGVTTPDEVVKCTAL
jgi:type II secretory ATPase GspE/PulE/Tfp pilus assembly ATPase PilB-like protein